MLIKPSLILTLVLSAVTLYACKHNDVTQSNAPQNNEEATPATGFGGNCQIDDPSFAQGQHLDDVLINRIKAQTSAKIHRVLKPNQPVTMEYNSQRVNITVDDANKVVLITCG